MKKGILILLLTMIFLKAYPQKIRNVHDQSMYNQFKREVYAEWGNWYPKKPGLVKSILRPDLGLFYSMHWGSLAPKKMKNYKKGDDKRPLSPNGLQNQRFLEYVAYKEQMKITREKTDSIFIHTKKELVNNMLIGESDPIYLLYFKKMFKELENYKGYENYLSQYEKIKKESLNNNKELTFKKVARDEKFGKEMDETVKQLKEQLKIAKNSTMARGKRMIMYHQILEQWQMWEGKIVQYVNLYELYDKLVKKQSTADVFLTKKRTDEEIMLELINNARNK